jgi:hypothetical protein
LVLGDSALSPSFFLRRDVPDCSRVGSSASGANSPGFVDTTRPSRGLSCFLSSCSTATCTPLSRFDAGSSRFSTDDHSRALRISLCGSYLPDWRRFSALAAYFLSSTPTRMIFSMRRIVLLTGTERTVRLLARLLTRPSRKRQMPKRSSSHQRKMRSGEKTKYLSTTEMTRPITAASHSVRKLPMNHAPSPMNVTATAKKRKQITYEMATAVGLRSRMRRSCVRHSIGCDSLRLIVITWSQIRMKTAITADLSSVISVNGVPSTKPSQLESTGGAEPMRGADFLRLAREHVARRLGRRTSALPVTPAGATRRRPRRRSD